MSVCERVFSAGFGPGLDSMSPARSRRPPAMLRGCTVGFPKNWVAGPPERRGKWMQFAQCSPRLWHTNHEQAVTVWCMLTTIVIFKFYRYERHYVGEHGVWL